MWHFTTFHGIWCESVSQLHLALKNYFAKRKRRRHEPELSATMSCWWVFGSRHLLNKNQQSLREGKKEEKRGRAERLAPDVGAQIRGTVCLVISAALMSWSKHTEETPPACVRDRNEAPHAASLSCLCSFCLLRWRKSQLRQTKSSFGNLPMCLTSPSSEGDIKF